MSPLERLRILVSSLLVRDVLTEEEARAFREALDELEQESQSPLQGAPGALFNPPPFGTGTPEGKAIRGAVEILFGKKS